MTATVSRTTCLQEAGDPTEYKAVADRPSSILLWTTLQLNSSNAVCMLAGLHCLHCYTLAASALPLFDAWLLPLVTLLALTETEIW